MKLIISPSNDPYFNLALEQYVFDNLDKNEEYFMLWQNDNAIIVGLYQNSNNEIKHDVVKEKNIKVVRRLSGGGAVYHDMGNLNFTYITNKKDNNIDFSIFLNPIAYALSNFGPIAEVNGRNDITIDGKKISGNAQYVKRGRVMHHGTLLFNSDLSVLASCLNVSKEKIAAKGVQSVASRVTNIKPYLAENIDIEQFKVALLAAIFAKVKIQEYTLTIQDIQKVNAIKKECYILDDWNYGKSPVYNYKRKKRFEGIGSIEVYAEVNETIQNIAFYGDFFSRTGIDDFVKCFTNVPLDRQKITEALQDIEVSDVFTGLSLEQLLDLLLSNDTE